MKTIENNTKIKTLKKLGFTFLETAEIVSAIRQLQADYQVFYFKMRNFHWDVKGPDFFELHEEFEKEYNAAKANIDILAERIKAFGLKPGMSIKNVIEKSKIDDCNTDKTSIEMVQELVMDYNVLHNSMLGVVSASLEVGDNVTEQIVTDFMRQLETRNWMFTAWLKDS